MLQFVRRWRVVLGVGALMIFAPADFASAVSIDWVTVANPGNAADATGYGAVAYTYEISRTEVTNAQYAEFLNAKAASDPLGLYNTQMALAGGGGITRTGSSGSFTYSVPAGRESLPVHSVSFYDTLRFSNWLSNGQGSGDTETGAYTLLGGTATPSNGTSVTRNPGANIVLASEDEWYKAAYYDAATVSFFAYPAGSNAPMTCAAPGPTANTANCDWVTGELTAVGSYTGSASPSGTFDQGGNLFEWNEALISGSYRTVRGGGISTPASFLGSTTRVPVVPSDETYDVGFRVARVVPEPGTGILLMTGLLGLAARQRRTAMAPLVASCSTDGVEVLNTPAPPRFL